MIKIDVFVKDKNWKKYISNPAKYLKDKVKFINSSTLFNKKYINFSILLAGNKEIKMLNNKFRKKNKTTNILSFPFYKRNEIKKKIKNEDRIYLGDIILNFYKIKKKARKNEFEKEFNKLWIHGLLHLLGYQHDTNKDFYKMRKLENRIFKQTEKTKC
ncbi:MAG: rRNA maturation RNase YbeY [Pelagibacteraceae bacterium]|nr:rRNA maturation RNase YbeY [Pelagibacteraceae bacterium]